MKIWESIDKDVWNVIAIKSVPASFLLFAPLTDAKTKGKLVNHPAKCSDQMQMYANMPPCCEL